MAQKIDLKKYDTAVHFIVVQYTGILYPTQDGLPICESHDKRTGTRSRSDL